MKKMIFCVMTLASVMAVGTTEAKPYPYPKQVKPHYVSIGVEYQDIKVDRFESSGSSPSFSLGYGYRFNRYFELGANVSVKTGSGVTSTFSDTYAIPDHSSGSPVLGEPMTATYHSSLNHSVLAGINAKAVLPIADNFDLYAMVGGVYGRIKHRGFAHADGGVLVDHKNNAKTTEDYLAGIANNKDECFLTGVESACPNGKIEPVDEVFNSVSLSYGAGVRWLWRDGGSVHIINLGANSLFREDDFSIFSYGVNYEFQF